MSLLWMIDRRNETHLESSSGGEIMIVGISRTGSEGADPLGVFCMLSDKEAF